MRILTLIFTLLFALPAMALWGGGETSATDAAILDGKTILNLSEQAHKTVPQDRLQATLTIEHEAATPKEVQNYINQKMSAALDQARRLSDVKTETQRYQVYKREHWEPIPNLVRDDEGKPEQRKIIVWHGSQSLQMETMAPESLLKFTGDLQEQDFAINNLSYALSRESADSYRDELVSQALDRIKHRAALIGKQLGLPKVHFAEINFDGGNQPIRQYNKRVYASAMAMDGAAEMAAPVAEAGETEVNVTVTTTVYLSK